MPLLYILVECNTTIRCFLAGTTFVRDAQTNPDL